MSAERLAESLTISMQTVRYEDGTFGVDLYVTGLTSQAHADAACEHMQVLFCGNEITAQG
jgi:hypothetical protein